MTDTREAILSQLEQVIFPSISGLRNVFRNRDQVTKDDFPAIILLDGVEDLSVDVIQTTQQRMPPAIMTLRPQVWMACKPRDTVENTHLDGHLNPIGPELSMWRVAILNAVLNDPALLNLVGPMGQIVYEGCETDMMVNSSVKGHMMLRFAFRYALFPSRA